MLTFTQYAISCPLLNYIVSYSSLSNKPVTNLHSCSKKNPYFPGIYRNSKIILFGAFWIVFIWGSYAVNMDYWYDCTLPLQAKHRIGPGSMHCTGIALLYILLQWRRVFADPYKVFWKCTKCSLMKTRLVERICDHDSLSTLKQFWMLFNTLVQINWFALFVSK